MIERGRRILQRNESLTDKVPQSPTSLTSTTSIQQHMCKDHSTSSHYLSSDSITPSEHQRLSPTTAGTTDRLVKKVKTLPTCSSDETEILTAEDVERRIDNLLLSLEVGILTHSMTKLFELNFAVTKNSHLFQKASRVLDEMSAEFDKEAVLMSARLTYLEKNIR